jgi:tetratricopeptide (TPR) repeat protein
VSHAVFLSYARSTSRTSARALHDAFGGDTCFLDTDDLDLGEEFPRRLTEALLASRVFVAFVDETYFKRWYCLREWSLARAAFDELLRRGTSQTALVHAIDHIVVALGSNSGALLAHLPPELSQRTWPHLRETRKLEALVRSKLSKVRFPISSLYDKVGVPLTKRSAMVDEAAVPLPKSLAGLPMYPKVLPQSLRSGFVGRANDLWGVHVALAEPRLDAVQVAALTGALQGGGGFGKTRLALEYVHRFGPLYYPGGCFWIDAAGDVPLKRQFHGVLRVLREGVPPIEAMREVGRDVRAELIDALHVEASTRSILFVVDNVPEPGPDTGPVALETWCPALGKVTCLATSRKRLDTSGAIESIDVGVLDPGPAVVLLSSGVPGHGQLTEAEWLEIAEWVGHLPLALTLLHAALSMSAISPARLLERCRRESTTTVLDDQRNALRGAAPSGTLRGMTEAFATSYELLSPDARLLGRVIAWLAPAPIPNEVLVELSNESSGAAARVALVDRSFLLEARCEDSGTSPRWQMHRVIGDFLRLQSTDPLGEMLVGLSSLNSVFESLNIDDPDERSIGLALVEHAVQLANGLKLYRDRWPVGTESRAADAMRHTANHLYELGKLTRERAPLKAALLGFRTASLYTIRERLPLEWAMTQNSLGSVLSRLGEREEGTAFLEQALAAYRAALEVYTREHEPLQWAMTQNSLGSVLSKLGEREAGKAHFDQALAAYQGALELCTRERAPLQWALTQNNLGNMLSTLGEREEGTACLERAVVAYRAALEVYTRERAPADWAMVQSNLGNLLTTIGKREGSTTRLEEAVAAGRAALEVSTRERMPLRWAITQNNLGEVLSTLGKREEDTTRLKEAVAAYRSALDVFESSEATYFSVAARQGLAETEALLKKRLKRRGV